MLSIPMIGCASHRLNLAVNVITEEYDNIFDKIDDLFALLRTKKRSLVLHLQTNLKPIKRNATRWSGKYKVLKRYFELKPHLYLNDHRIARLMPSPLMEKMMKDLLEGHLSALQLATKELQSEMMNLKEAGDILLEVAKDYPQVADRIGYPSQIMHSPHFEMGIIKILEGREQHLTGAENQAVSIFRKQERAEEDANEDGGSLADRIAKKRKLANQTETKSAFIDLKFIPPTSNHVERLFSKARLTVGMT